MPSPPHIFFIPAESVFCSRSSSSRKPQTANERAAAPSFTFAVAKNMLSHYYTSRFNMRSYVRCNSRAPFEGLAYPLAFVLLRHRRVAAPHKKHIAPLQTEITWKSEHMCGAALFLLKFIPSIITCWRRGPFLLLSWWRTASKSSSTRVPPS